MMNSFAHFMVRLWSSTFWSTLQMILPLSAACIGCKWTKSATWLVLSYAITTIEKITPAIRLHLFCQWVLLLIPYFITVWPSIKKLHTLFALSVANTTILSNPLGYTSVSKPGLWQMQHVSIISPSAKFTIYRYRCLTISKASWMCYSCQFQPHILGPNRSFLTQMISKWNNYWLSKTHYYTLQ